MNTDQGRHMVPGCGYLKTAPAHRWACLGEPLPVITIPAAPEPEPPFTATTEQVRAWAKAEGKAVKDRGRLPGSLLREYAAAHPA